MDGGLPDSRVGNGTGAVVTDQPTHPIHLEVLVEELSAKVALDLLLPRVIPAGATFVVHAFEGRARLLARLEQRLRGYRFYSPNTRILVLVDRDDDDCRALKARLEQTARASGMPTLSTPEGGTAASGRIRVCNRIVCEELEAWFLGDPQALCAAYPKVKASFASQTKYRNPDAIVGGTWEAMAHLLNQAGHYRDRARFPKVEVAQTVTPHLDPDRNTSSSFRVFIAGVRRLTGDLP